MELKQRAFIHQNDATAFASLSLDSLFTKIDGRLVLADISLQIANGETVGLLGRDGAGKTTCFETITGLLPATSGRVLLSGVDVTSWPFDHRAKAGLAYLPEAVSVFRGLTVEENILLALEVLGLPTALQEARLESLLTQFELALVRHQRATTVSGGERRRCEIARAMAVEPKIVLLDEPFRGLDPTSIASTRRTIGNLKGRSVGVLVSDYDLRDLLGLLDRVYVLHEGQLIFNGTAQELLSDADVRHLYLGKSFSL